jgi:acetyl esterase
LLYHEETTPQVEHPQEEQLMTSPLQYTLSTLLILVITTTASAQDKKVKTPARLKGAQYEIYKTASGTDLGINIFTPVDHKPTDSRPAIVFFFGGGWNGGNPSQFQTHCQYLASRGMVAIAADYRVKSRQNTPPSACVEDGKSAIRWVRKHARRLAIDPDRIAAGGGSAGGHVAAATATTDGFDTEGEDLSISSRPNALVLFNPVYDNGPKGYGNNRVKDYWKQISPLHNLKKGTPPAIVFLGTNDKLIPVKTAEEYKGRMEAVGSRSDLHLYEGQPHGFFNFSRSPKFYRDTVLKMDRFLTSLGYLNGEPNLELLPKDK